MKNKEIAKILYEIADLLEMKKGDKARFKSIAYKKAGLALENLKTDVKTAGKLPGIGKGISEKINEYLKTGKIEYYEELQEETAIQQIITHFFETKGVSLKELKQNAKKKKIVYSRYTRTAKQLLELAGSIEKAKKTITTVADWANSMDLDYTIETVFKKWLELDKLKPKEIIKKPFYDGNPMHYNERKQKWYVIAPTGEWLEYADKKSKIEWRIIK